ncbi:hypothetical protein [Ponticoccus alexandrii]|uniref:PhiE125 gp8 family phage protein n=1 Tax=Ponticoccus alexandrii TaxID=1943633 RepID=A0ABX7F7Y2_9RHOB|nr:hypothetical protein [Ponticoccus alexandrii]ETA53979.1 hypothetical protein P279_00335 [Rhodobacteraceae bacterium PD-2]QRF66377.1 hypothetical protein GQA70_08680 [Ponticoccus alexandrii]
MQYLGEAPQASAVDLDAFKTALDILPDDVASDDHFSGLLAAASDAVRIATNVPAPGSYAFTFALPRSCRRWWFPCRPVTALASVSVNDAAGDWQALPLDGFRLALAHDEPQLVFPSSWSPGADADTCRVVAEVGADPTETIKRAVIMLAKEWRDSDISVGEAVEAPRLSMRVRDIIRQATYRRPCAMAGW